MEDPGRALTVTRVQAIAYQARASGRKVNALNHLVKLGATTRDGKQLVGIGEGQLRTAATGDRNESSWNFLVACLRKLHEREITVTDPSTAVATVRELMGQFRELAEDHHSQGHIDFQVPFRGTLLGLEVALLDLFGRALDVPVAELLGRRRGSAPAHPTGAPPRESDNALRQRLESQADGFPASHLSGLHTVEENLELLTSAAAVNRSEAVGQPGKPLWINLKGAFDTKEATRFLKAVAGAISEGKLPREIYVEQPVPTRERYYLPLLQRTADRIGGVLPRRGADIRIVSDQAAWNTETAGRRARYVARFGRWAGLRPPRAAHIKPAQVGGLLASIEMGERLRKSHPKTRIYLGAAEGATTVTGAAIRNLTAAMPELDAVVEGTLADESVVAAPTEPGLGVPIPYEEFAGDAENTFSVPEPVVATHDGASPNVYPEVTYLQPLGSNGTKGHLLEREALMLGLDTVRYNKGAFIATDGDHEPLSFKWSRSPLSSAVSLALCTHKEATRMRLRRAGVPVPKGNTFAKGDFDAAREFVRRIGYPVVVKPAMGVRGIGVVADIRDDEALEQAFRHLSDSTLGDSDFIVEQHVPGRDYRIVVIGDEVIGAILREPGSVTGDGESTVAELMIAKNVARRGNPHLWGRPIKYDDTARFLLERSGMTLSSVPEKGQRVLLSGSCSLSQGGDSIDVLGEMHPSIKQACVDAVHAVPGLAFCGVDFLLEDHTKPLDEQHSGICELNAHAAIGNCEYPLYGQGREVARTLMNECVSRFGLHTTERRDNLALHMIVRGRVTGVGYRAWIRRHAEEYGLTGWVRNVQDRMVEIVAAGDSEPVTALAALAVLGPSNAVPTDVTTTHIQPPDVSGFEAVEAAPKEITHVR
ncbi:acylphosphatase [Haloechinothrix sp. LS1_15]|uniref:acylphosphatase n=1 Tax=Haloechinothrix sp. LS1_15 TaxID=2652248 RepID=UPI002947C83E|nr:acylphosphatase [Haloechinothrix sp. LS1_15]MDV6011081.1 ATP-grasp domain-containing protein [Haloechinothrix sp. LS1_15]